MAEHLKSKLTKSQQLAIEQTSEKGASSWLTSIPLAKYDFTLHKQAFRDALCLRFGWTPIRLPSHCSCGKPLTVDHAFSCPKGALPSIRHNHIRDITANFLTEVCPNVCIEPTLQPLTGESFPLHTTNTEEGARLDIKAKIFWDNSQKSTFLMSESSIHLPPLTPQPPQIPLTEDTKRRKEESTNNESTRLSTEPLLNWSSLQVVDGGRQPRLHSEDWQD